MVDALQELAEIAAPGGVRGGVAGEAIPSGVWIVIPAYNEAPTIQVVIEGFLATPCHLVVVDDGSEDDTSELVRRTRRAHLCRHVVNLGQGAALQTGIQYALDQGARYIVTFDADGQHGVEDVCRLLRPLVEDDYQVALGSRFVEGGRTEGLPLTRRLLLRLATAMTRLVLRMDVHDTHNGLRAFTARAGRRIAITQNRMGHAGQILKQIQVHRLRFCEVPVAIRYTDYSLAKGQSSLNALNILWESCREFLRT